MKRLSEFDASCLRERKTCSWHWRLSCLTAAVLGVLGVLCLIGLVLFSTKPGLAFQGLPVSLPAQLMLGGIGLALIGVAYRIRKGSLRRRLRQGALNLAPHLLKKHH